MAKIDDLLVATAAIEKTDPKQAEDQPTRAFVDAIEAVAAKVYAANRKAVAWTADDGSDYRLDLQDDAVRITASDVSGATLWWAMYLPDPRELTVRIRTIAAVEKVDVLSAATATLEDLTKEQP